MPWSFSVATIGGVDVRVHATLVLLLFWIGLAHAMGGGGAWEVGSGLALVVGIFVSVLLHELGHALAARAFGVRTRDITLLPLGGLSRLERVPPRPSHELIVALTGPAVNLLLALVLAVGLDVFGLELLPSDLLAVGGPLLAQLMWVNVSLALFNLVPAFPSDGGRALRAVLASFLGRTRATDIAAAIGKAVAALLALVGLLTNPLVGLAAILLYMAAADEQRWARLLAAIEGLPVERAMVTGYQTLDAGTRLAHAAALVIAGAPSDFPVTDGERLVGVLTRDDLATGLATGGPGAAVAAHMQRDIEILPPSAPLESAADLVRAGVPVVIARDGELVGVLSAETIPELASFARALTAEM